MCKKENKMAYQGYLIKVGDYKIPHSMIRANTYQAYRNGQDLDSFRNGNGELNRTALEHFVIKIEFETIAMLTDDEFGDLMSNISSNYINKTEKKLVVSAYIPELNNYITQEAYMPDVKPTIYFADGSKVQYNPIRLAFIGY